MPTARAVVGETYDCRRDPGVQSAAGARAHFSVRAGGASGSRRPRAGWRHMRGAGDVVLSVRVGTVRGSVCVRAWMAACNGK